MEKGRLFDSHCHLDDERFAEDREQLVASLPDGGVAGCVTVGCDLESAQRSIELAAKYPFLYAAVGIHPHVAAEAPADYLDRLSTLLQQPKVQALGETGLDYHYDFCPRDVQRRVLEEHLDLAVELDVPVILHVREAHGDMMSLLRSRAGSLPSCVLHCFSGSAESAMEYVSLGMMISFAGPVTFKNANKLLRAAETVPADHLMIETDSPYLAPVPMRGKRNDPALVSHVCRRLAELRGQTYEEMAELTYRNACRFYRIPQ
ncbi:MAG: TatD family hydrolase [Clostridiales bacterium]|jgi:TatD DNase family protein|nr:TatD family hydrolase [Clostridiales bacterium]